MRTRVQRNKIYSTKGLSEDKPAHKQPTPLQFSSGVCVRGRGWGCMCVVGSRFDCDGCSILNLSTCCFSLAVNGNKSRIRSRIGRCGFEFVGTTFIDCI